MCSVGHSRLVAIIAGHNPTSTPLEVRGPGPTDSITPGAGTGALLLPIHPGPRCGERLRWGLFISSRCHESLKELLRLESKVCGRLVERKRSLDFDFPLAQASLYPVGPCQPLLFSKAKALLPPSSVGLSALLCKQDPGLAARPHTGNEPAFRSPATSSSHPETP